jgi:hypothetical protein
VLLLNNKNNFNDDLLQMRVSTFSSIRHTETGAWQKELDSLGQW